jgi:hypothetical protein
LDNGTSFDVRLLLGTEATPFPAHKIVLAVSSSHFSKLFFGNGNGPAAEERTDYEIKNCSPQTFRILLEVSMWFQNACF